MRSTVLFLLGSTLPCVCAEDIPPLKPPRPELGPSFWSQYGWIVALAAVVVLGVLAFWINWRRRPKPVSITPPEVFARSSLQALRGKADDDKVVPEVSRILRHYVIAVFGLPPDELTTTELQKALQHQSSLSPDLSATIVDFLRQCDEWKFAADSAPPRLDPAASALELLERTEACRKDAAKAVEPQTSAR